MISTPAVKARTGISYINEYFKNLRRHTGRTYRSDKWSDYNFYQYLSMKKRVLEINKMASIKEQAKAYELPQRKNIAELKSVNVNTEIAEEEFTKTDGEKFTINTIEVDGVKYRVPTSVLAELKVMIEAKPEMANFKVSKSGEGLNTKYSVIPL